MNVIATVVIGYLLGSVPIARMVTGRDLRVVGDRNPGYWNAKEAVGRRAALPVFVGDLAKGALAAAVGLLLAGHGPGPAAGAGGGAGSGGGRLLLAGHGPGPGVGLLLAGHGPGQWWLGYVGGAAAMVGHAWPAFDRFRGGRSVLAFAGAVCVLSPLAAAVAVAVLVVTWRIAHDFAVAARVGVFGFPVAQIVIDGPYRTAATGGLMCIIGLRFALARRGAARSQP